MKNHTIMTPKSWRYTQFWQQLYIITLGRAMENKELSFEAAMTTAALNADEAYLAAFTTKANIEMKDLPKLARAFIRKETLVTIEASRKDDPD